MSRNKRDGVILSLLILLLLALNYSFFDDELENFLNKGATEKVFVDRVIDGDTIEAKGKNESIRLLGINTPERGEVYYNEAKKFLEDKILKQNVTLKFTKERYDKYDRLPAYVFLEQNAGSENVNVEMVRNGFANHYFYSGSDIYSEDLLNAWKICIENEVNLCEPSEHVCKSCIVLKKDSVLNSCRISCNISGWQIKGEGREKFIFENQELKPDKESKFSLDLTNTGGDLFLRDSEGKLVLWKG